MRRRAPSLMGALSELPDPRKPSNGKRHDFREILVIALCAMLSDADSFEDFALWGRMKEAWLRRFLRLEHGVPSADTFLRVFRILDPKHFEAVFRRWVAGIVPALDGEVVAVDGKSLRGSRDGEMPAVHMVSAFASALNVVLGQEKVSDKSNEIVAIPKLLETLYLEGALVTIDAVGCQKDIAEAIVEQRADYLLAVKANQPGLLAAIEAAFNRPRLSLPSHEQELRAHGRTVYQLAWSMPAKGVVDPANWAQCKCIGLIVSQRVGGHRITELERRYYISSRELSAEQLAEAARAHWGIENRLHWILDVTFGEDASTLRKDHAPQNLSLLKKIVLNLIRLDKTDTAKTSLRQKRKRAAWDDDIRMNMLGLRSL